MRWDSSWAGYWVAIPSVSPPSSIPEFLVVRISFVGWLVSLLLHWGSCLERGGSLFNAVSHSQGCLPNPRSLSLPGNSPYLLLNSPPPSVTSVSVCVCVCVCVGERDRETERQRQTDRHTLTQRERERKREREGERERERCKSRRKPIRG
jgi:hypothetical protein